MFVIQITDVVAVLKLFNCDPNVLSIDLIAHFQVEKKVVLIIKAKTYSKDYILKFYSDSIVDIKKENLQCEFSEFLFAKGVAVPHKYAVNGEYVVKLKFGNIFFLVTAEDVFGEDVEIISEESAYHLGRILAEIHRTSLQADYHLPMGIAFNSLYSSKVEYESIWKNINLPIKDDIEEKTRKIHNESIERLRQLWKGLPVCATHGDLGITSNLMFDLTKGYGVIDFNLAGDEILLSDLLITWYSSRYSEKFIRQVDESKIADVKQAYFSGYFERRQLDINERSVFPEFDRIINGLYFSKYVVLSSEFNDDKKTSKLYQEIIYNFKHSDIVKLK